MQVDELKQMVLMMTGHSKNEESRGGENEESRGNVRETAGKKKKDGWRQSVQQKRGKRVSGEELSGIKTLEELRRCSVTREDGESPGIRGVFNQ